MDFWTLPTNMEGYEQWLPKKFTPGEKSDPKIIGADDVVSYAERTPEELKDVPPVLVDVEVRELLPLAKLMAEYIGITPLQEAQYGNVLQEIRQRSVHVVLNVMKPKIGDGVATYHGLVVMCKQHPIVRVICKCQLSTGRFGVAQVHLWHKDPSYEGGGVYYRHGDRKQKRPMPAHEVVPLVMEYLESRERVLTRV